MYKLLIVDDNPLERDGIASMLDWASYDIEVVGTCQNGKIGLQAAETLKPDIILTDIFMPVMDGIEMVKQVRKKNNGFKIIFMSCHDDFEYAKSAVDLGVEYYLLKPIFKNDLAKALLKVLNKKKIENTLNYERQEMMKALEQSYPVLRDQFFRQLLFGFFNDINDITNRIDFLKIKHLKDNLLCTAHLVISEAEMSSPDNGIRQIYMTAYSLIKIIESYCTEGLHIYPLQISVNEYVLICSTHLVDEIKAKNVVLDTIIKIKDSVSEQLLLNTLIGVSKFSSMIADAPVLYKQSLHIAKAKYYCKASQIIFYSDIEDIDCDAFEEKVNLQELHKEIKELMFDLTTGRMNEFVNKYMGDSLEVYSETYVKSFAYSVITVTQLVLFEMNESFKNIINDEVIIWDKLSRFETIGDVKQWLINILDMLRQHLYVDNNSRHRKLIEQVKQIIHVNYANQITVTDISKSIFVSNGYANNVFKNYEGKTIFDYLLEYRVEVAKKLLRDPDKKIYEVAENVGYNNQSHFGLLFKTHTGLTPKEYRNKYEADRQ